MENCTTLKSNWMSRNRASGTTLYLSYATIPILDAAPLARARLDSVIIFLYNDNGGIHWTPLDGSIVGYTLVQNHSRASVIL